MKQPTFAFDSLTKSSMYTQNRTGLKTLPCLTPFVARKYSEKPLQDTRMYRNITILEVCVYVRLGPVGSGRARVVEFSLYSRGQPTIMNFVRPATTRSTVVGVIHEFHRRRVLLTWVLTCRWEIKEFAAKFQYICFGGNEFPRAYDTA